MQGGIQPELPPKHTVGSGCSGLDPTLAGRKAVQQDVDREEQKEKKTVRSLFPPPPKKQWFTSGAVSVHNKLVSLPSVRVTLFAFLQIVSTFCINNPSASKGEGESTGARGEGVGGNQMSLLLLKKKVEDAEKQLGAGALADQAESCHRACVQTWRKKSKQGGDYI